MFPTKTLCPRCKCDACYPLHRKGIDWLLSSLGLRPARCLTCLRKFYTRYTHLKTDKPRAVEYQQQPVNASSEETSAPKRPRAA